MTRTHNAQKGSVFIYILMAIALLGALSYAVSRGNRTNTSALTAEQAKLAAQEIIEYGNTVATAVQKLRLRGCNDVELDFANSTWKNQDNSLIHPEGHNPNSLSECDLFNISASQISPQQLTKTSFNEPAAASHAGKGMARIRVSNLPNVGSNEAELVYQLSQVKNSICLQINKILGVENIANSPPIFGETTFDYTGAFPSMPTTIDTNGKITGKLAFCATRDGSTNHKYVQVLIAR